MTSRPRRRAGAPQSAPPQAELSGRAASELAERQRRPLQRVQHVLHAHPGVSPPIILVVTCVVFTALNPRFSEPGTVSLMVQQTAVVAALAVGQTLIILTAGIDLSVGASAILSMMVMASYVREHGLPGGGRPACSGSARYPGRVLNGLLVTRLEAATVHRHAGHAQRLHRDHAALHRGQSIQDRSRCRTC